MERTHAARLARLERENRGMKAILLCLACIFLMGSKDRPEVLRVRGLIVEDSSGSERISIGDIDLDGICGYGMGVRDSQGRPRMIVAGGDEQSGLAVISPDGSGVLAGSGTGESQIEVRAAGHYPRVALFSDSQGAEVSIYDSNAQVKTVIDSKGARTP